MIPLFPAAAATLESMTGTDLSSTAIIVVNFGSHELLEANLVVVSSESPEATVVVVDNFISLEERQHVVHLCLIKGWTSVLLDANVGFGEGVNAGVSAALAGGVSTLVILNPDAVIHRESVERLVSRTVDEPMSMVAPIVLDPLGRVWFSGSDVYMGDGRMGNPRARAENPAREYREWLSGACLALSSLLWGELKGFDPDYFLYWEDVDLSFRVVEAGGRLVVERDAEAIHDEGGTHTEVLRGRAKSETYYYYNIRNRLIYAAKTLDDEHLAKWLRATRRVSYEILLQGGRAQFARPLIPLRAYLRGTRDGRRFVRDTRPSA